MPRVAVVCAHPNLSVSRANRIMLEALSGLPDVTISRLYDRYPDFHIDTTTEQAMLREVDTIVLQFPLYWYSSPPLLKAWIDSIFTEGFAYGEKADGLAGKRLMIAVSADASAEFCAEHDAEGQPNLFSLTDLLGPFKAIAAYCKMVWEPEFAIFSVWQKTDEQLAKEAANYRDRLLNF